MNNIHHPMICAQVVTTVVCPEQHHGQLTDGRWFYFRMRSGWASLAIGAFYEQTMGRMDYRLNVCHDSDPLRGWFEDDQERDEAFAKLLDMALGEVQS